MPAGQEQQLCYTIDMTNPFKLFEKRDWVLWIGSMVILTIAGIATPDTDPLTLIMTLFGVTTLIFSAVGSIWAPVITIAFCVMYAVIAWGYRYWSEVITFLGLSVPMSVASLVTWIRNPSKREGEVKVRTLSRRTCILIVVASIPVTAFFGVVLRKLNTPNLSVSTVSITTSFLGAAFIVLRSPWYALGYALNDIVLIVLWTLASLTDPKYIPVVVEFVIFLVNDLYAFYSWRRRERELSK